MRSRSRPRKARRVVRRPSGRRRAGGSVSGRATAATTTRISAITASTTKTPRHEVNRSTSPPIVGASTGATPSTSISRENRVAAARPTNRSRTIAIVTTDAAAAPTPCSTRSPPSTATFGATRISSDASTCTPTPASSGRRRPKVSDRGPTSSWPSASPTSVPVNVSWTAADVVSRSSTIVGSAGRYMSIVSGPSAISAPRTRTSRSRPHPVGATTGGAVGCRVTVTSGLSGLYASGKYFPVQGGSKRDCSHGEDHGEDEHVWARHEPDESGVGQDRPGERRFRSSSGVERRRRVTVPSCSSRGWRRTRPRSSRR